jgi:hypothetical protein
MKITEVEKEKVKKISGVNRTLDELFRIYADAVVNGTEDSALRIRKLIRGEADKQGRK